MKPLLEILHAGTGYLEKHGVEEARLNMEHLIAHVLGCRRLDIYLRFGEMLKEPDLSTLRALLKRRGDGEPLQHLLGTVEFMGHEFVSDQRALVPRPETECLAELLLKKFATAPPSGLLDMGTGSGCLGLSLALGWPGHTPIVYLVDISEDALDLARLNASRLIAGSNSLAPHFVRSDLFEKIPGQFDLIVANLPYIPAAEINDLSREVRRDPILALDGGPDGLDIVRRFLTDVSTHLNPGGWIALEVGHDQGPATAELAKAAGFEHISQEKDLQGIGRFVLACLPASSN